MQSKLAAVRGEIRPCPHWDVAAAAGGLLRVAALEERLVLLDELARRRAAAPRPQSLISQADRFVLVVLHGSMLRAIHPAAAEAKGLSVVPPISARPTVHPRRVRLTRS